MRYVLVGCVTLSLIVAVLAESAEAQQHRAGRQDVTALQQALKDKGHDPGPVDGAMGPRTTAALRDFQKTQGLKQTGRVDAETRTKLNLAEARAGGAAMPPAPVGASREKPKPGPGASTTTPDAELGKDAATKTDKQKKR